MLNRAILASAALAFAAACGTSYNNSSSGGATGSTGALTVSAKGTSFSPSTMSVSAGQTVTWRNDDSIDHTVTSGTNCTSDGKFDQVIHPGETFQYTFPTAGSFPYFCRFHCSMGMTGTVSVTGSSQTTGGTTSGGTTSGGTTSGGATGGY